MAFWSVREELSRVSRLRRSYYELLRDDLDQFILDYALVNSYQRFLNNGVPYPFVEKRELKPRARIPGIEHKYQNTFLVIFVEDTVPARFKKYIRFFNLNRTTKTNLIHSKELPLPDNFYRNQKYIDSAHFYDLIKMLLPVDYALLIQRDPGSHLTNRYMLSHFHVRIDWPIAEAAENLAQSLRYISKDLYEKGDQYAETAQKKFFEYYGVPVMVGGRRTAAIVAAQYLKQIPCISTVYVGSSEARALIRISERGASKSILTLLTEAEILQVCNNHSMALPTFNRNYVITREGNRSVCILQVSYAYTNYARPPDDGKLREINPDVNWLTVGQEHILPKPHVFKYPPLPVSLIYS